MNSFLLSDEKQTHLAHVIMTALKDTELGSISLDSPLVLKEIKRVIAEQLQEEMTLINLFEPGWVHTLVLFPKGHRSGMSSIKNLRRRTPQAKSGLSPAN